MLELRWTHSNSVQVALQFGVNQSVTACTCLQVPIPKARLGICHACMQKSCVRYTQTISNTTLAQDCCLVVPAAYLSGPASECKTVACYMHVQGNLSDHLWPLCNEEMPIIHEAGFKCMRPSAFQILLSSEIWWEEFTFGIVTSIIYCYREYRQSRPQYSSLMSQCFVWTLHIEDTWFGEEEISDIFLLHFWRCIMHGYTEAGIINDRCLLFEWDPWAYIYSMIICWRNRPRFSVHMGDNASPCKAGLEIHRILLSTARAGARSISTCQVQVRIWPIIRHAPVVRDIEIQLQHVPWIGYMDFEHVTVTSSID